MTTAPALPTTPAEVAGAVLDAIAAHPEAFDMGTWYDPQRDDVDGQAATLAPDAPPCGATMCAAGWAAHVTGWTLVYDLNNPLITVVDDDDTEDADYFYARKDGQERHIWEVAREALGLDDYGLFHGRKSTALDGLRVIAGR